MNVTDYQDVYLVTTGGQTSFKAENRNLHTEGVELQGTWRPITGLSLGASGAFLKSHDERGTDAARAPSFAGSANARYETPISNNWKVAALANVYHTEGYLNNVADTNPQLTRTRPYSLLDLGVEAFQDNGLSLKFVVQNVTNTHSYLIVSQNPTIPSTLQGALMPLRRMTVTAGYKF